MKRVKKLLVLLPVVALMIGCSESASSKVWNKSEVVKALDLKTDNGISYTFRQSNGTLCDVAVVMTTSAAVKMYADAGDTVATNPDKSAGVKIVAEEQRDCLEAAEKILKTLK